jgi:hypothetical protein
MIAIITFPHTISSVRYGIATMFPDPDHTMPVPAYVAKTLLTLPGVTGPSLTDTALQLLSETEAGSEYEANNIFVAYGQSIPPTETRIADAVTLMTARGEPAVSMS